MHKFSLAYYIYVINKNNKDSLEKRLSDLDCTPLECQTLSVIKDHQVINQNALSLNLDLKKTIISQIIKSLAEKKLIIIEKNKSDQRSSEISLTELGLNKTNDYLKILNNYENELLSHLSTFERNSLELALRSIYAQQKIQNDS